MGNDSTASVRMQVGDATWQSSSDALASDTDHAAMPDASKGRRKLLRWFLPVLVAAGVLYYFMPGGGDTKEVQPLLVTVVTGDIENAVTAAGSLQPGEYVDVGAQVSGQLERLYVAVGDTVKSGDLVAEIDATVQMNKVEASRANLKALEAQLSARESALKLAEARLERQTQMRAQQASSQDDFDDAVDRLTSAESSLTQLR